MKHYLRIVLLIFLCLSKAVAQSPEIDSLKNQLVGSKDTARVNLLNVLGYKLVFSDPQEAEKSARESIQLAGQINFKRGQIKAYQVLGISFDLRANYPDAIDAYNAGLTILKQLDTVASAHRELHAALLNGLGTACYRQSKYQEAIVYFLHGISIAETLPSKSRLAVLLMNTGLVHHDQKELDHAIDYYTKALTFGEESGNKSVVGRAANNIGIIYKEKEKYTEAIRFYERSLKMKRELNERSGIGTTLSNLGVIYKRLGKYDEAMRYLQEASEIGRQVGDKLNLTIINDTKADLYILTKRYSLAKQLIDANYKLVQEIDTREPLLLVYERYIEFYKAQGQFEKAMEWQDRKILLNDSLFNEKKSQQLAELETRFQTEKKEQTIKLLEQEKALQDLWKYVLIAGMFLIATASFFIVLLQRSRARKAAQLLGVQQLLNEKLKEIDAAKSGFFANISHEFRTPLTLIKGPIEEFLEHPDPALTKEKALMIHHNSNRLLQLVNQLLDLSRIDSGSLKFEMKGGDVHKFLRVIATSFDSHALQYNYRYTIEVPGHAAIVIFDPDKLEKIAYNLLSNAFKFTPAGGIISFIASYEASQLMVAVTDNGEGISEKDLPYIFDRFYRSEAHATAAVEGTGIGLSLVQELVSFMGGKISVNSEKGKGATFVITLPMKEMQAESGEIPVSGKQVAHFSELHSHELPAEIPTDQEIILIVEDNAGMCDFIEDQLRPFYQVITAHNGKLGLQKATCEIPDLVITDVVMPEMDGITFCASLKNDARTSHIPVIMLTAKGGHENKMEGLGTGADDYLTKPFNRQELLMRIQNLIAQRHRLREKYSRQITLQPKDIVITSVDENFLKKIEDLIEKNLPVPEFGTPELQNMLAMSKTQFYRKIKALTGHTPGELIRNYRLRRAAQMLEKRSGNVTEIAFAVGFGSLSYFIRSFKELFGTVPSDYKGRS